jgi:hypothetical protein
MMFLIRPLLGLIQGFIAYWLLKHTHLDVAHKISYLIVLSFPLLALQIKLPSKDKMAQGIAILVAMGLIYGYAAYHLISKMSSSLFAGNGNVFILAVQCLVSAFILFIFYCVLMEEKRFHFPYPTLFSESWQVILKIHF